MIVAVIPALDEEGNVVDVVRGVLACADASVVVDNGSRDRTAERARQAGAIVVGEPRRGYGSACLAGVEKARALGATVILFLDADGGDDPTDAPKLLAPIAEGRADFVLGVRTPDTIERGAMMPVQRFGNWLAPLLMRILVGASYSDMPPFKAITREALDRIAPTDRGHGFIIEMLMRAHAEKLRVVEVPVRCRARRSGASKISGTVRGTIRASVKIVATIAKHAPPLRALSRGARLG